MLRVGLAFQPRLLAAYLHPQSLKVIAAAVATVN